MKHKKVATPENGNNSRAIIPLADPAQSVQPETLIEPIDIELAVDSINEELDELRQMLNEFVMLGSGIRIKIYGMLDRGFPARMNVKPTAMLDSIDADGVSGRHKYRHLQAAINEWEMGLPPNTLIESHSRHLDNLVTPEEKKQAYDLASHVAENGRLTAKCFEIAANLVIEQRLSGIQAINDPAVIESTAVNKTKTDSYSANCIFNRIRESCLIQDVGLLQAILDSNENRKKVFRQLLSGKVQEKEVELLSVMLMHWQKSESHEEVH